MGRAAPATVPAIARISSRALSARTYTDIPYKVFTSPRRVRFVEMEYAVPRAALVDTLRELKAMVDRSGLRVGFPVEVRTAPADDITLSTASGRDSAYIAVHMFRGTPYQAYFTAAERIFTAHEGGRTGARCTPGTPSTSHACTRASASSRRSGTGSTRNGCSRTPTCGGFWGRRRHNGHFTHTWNLPYRKALVPFPGIA